MTQRRFTPPRTVEETIAVNIAKLPDLLKKTAQELRTAHALTVKRALTKSALPRCRQRVFPRLLDRSLPRLN